jgi:hypothetical protein
MGLKRLQGRLDQLQGEANETMSAAQVVIALARALLLDLKDGAGLVFWPLKGFSAFVNRFIVCVAAYIVALLMTKLREFLPLVPKAAEAPQLDLTWMEGQPIPFRVAIDPEVDIMPHKLSRFVGGPYDGREFIVDPTKTELRLEPNELYRWDGKAFAFADPQE